MSIAFLWWFIALLAIGAPVTFALLLGPGLSLLFDGESRYFAVMLSRLYNGIDSFPLMAVPFFILAGEAMNRGGITAGLVRVSQSFLGHWRGGLAQMNIASSMLFAGLSGSAVADTSALGKVLIPAMERAGYSRRFAAAVTSASSVVGPIIPPSGLMILYAFVMKVPVAGLFAAGVVPGLMIVAGMGSVTGWLARRAEFPVASERASWRERVVALGESLPALLTPVILLGGILSGVFTPTEAAAVAAAYALVVGLFVSRSLRPRELPAVFVAAARQSGVILLLIGAAVAFAWSVTVSGLATQATAALSSLTDNVYALLLLVNLLLFVLGMFLDAGPAILILGPVLAPLFVDLGVHPVHFAIVMCVNLSVGLTTPPVGLVLFVASSLTGERPERIAGAMWPFLAVQVLVIMLITYVPALSLALPRAMGLLE
ncbi:MAG: TRAP transporter large permease [Pseudomonadota bacterium]